MVSVAARVVIATRCRETRLLLCVPGQPCSRPRVAGGGCGARGRRRDGWPNQAAWLCRPLIAQCAPRLERTHTSSTHQKRIAF
ncbi:unnamed protein product [Leptosia nina]|uniref:Secreted protein n=1 Tax=Leptosia nina TaxID=320188 RepID=A0AAV1JFV9_9NEOP